MIITVSCTTHHKLAIQSYHLTQSPESMERGRNLVYNGCGCHYNEEAKSFIGNQIRDLPKYLGHIYAANLTHSKKNGIVDGYTDAELAYLIKTGIRKDGIFIPYMIKPTLADEDVNDIILFLRSNDPALAAYDTSAGTTHLTAVGRIAAHLPGPQPFIEGIRRPAAGDAKADGKYLVDILSCYHCHSKSILSLNYVHPEQSKGYMQGGQKFRTLDGSHIRASNLTPDKRNGIGNYTKEAFRSAVREGEVNGAKIRFPMPKYKHLTDEQVDDIYTYLQSLPPKHNKRLK